MASDLVAWLREQVEADLDRWRGLAAAYAPNAEREGEVLLYEAREHVADCEAKLAILDLHKPTPGLRHPITDWHVDICAECATPELLREEWKRITTLYPCRTVRLLGSGYKSRSGYREEWKP